jgi:hypothetical protein
MLGVQTSARNVTNRARRLALTNSLNQSPGLGMMAAMGFSDRRVKRKMKYPVRGTLRVSGITDARPPRVRVTGVITAPGVPATAVEYAAGEREPWTGVEEVAVLVDRSEPSRFLILWDEPVPDTWKPPWPLSERMSAWLDQSLGESFGPGEEAEAQAMRESIIEVFAEKGPDAVTNHGWRVFAPTTEASDGAFPQASWPDGHSS